MTTIFTHSNMAILLAGALLMAMVTAICLVKSALLRISFVCNGVIALGLLSNTSSWLELLLALSICFHLWHAFKCNDGIMITLTAVAALLFVVILAAHLLLALPLFWVVIASLLLMMSGFFYAEQEQTKNTSIIDADDEVIHDFDSAPLLSLVNRDALRREYYHWRKDNNLRAALVIIRLEGFEQVNQHIGREFGDLLLAQSANRIKGILNIPEVLSIQGRNTEVQKLAHLGGLNFAFICNLSEQKHLHENLINKVLSETLKPFNVANCTIEVTARAGYVDCDEQESSFDNLISLAYLALDTHPEQRVIAYHQQMMIEQLEQQARLKELAHIDFNSEFELYFHPIVRNQDGEIEFIELLLRWQHPKQGILSANRFIDDIRIAGLAYPLAVFVIERAAELAMALRMENIAIPVSINVFGPEMLNEEYIEFIDKIINEHDLIAGDLIIECPLSLFMELGDQGKAMVARLNSIGVRVCVDGLGDSPVWLAKLPNLAVEYVKVAPALTADFSLQSHIRSLIGGMVDMHHQQNTKVICEGVETPEQYQFVKNLNAFAAQGYYFHHPLSSVGLISWLKQRRFES